jgi:hypothetical protein
MTSDGRTGVFVLAIVIGTLFIIGAVLYWTGWQFLGHGIKHGILAFVLGVLAFVFAAVMRPGGRTT